MGLCTFELTNHRLGCTVFIGVYGERNLQMMLVCAASILTSVEASCLHEKHTERHVFLRLCSHQKQLLGGVGKQTSGTTGPHLARWHLRVKKRALFTPLLANFLEISPLDWTWTGFRKFLMEWKGHAVARVIWWAHKKPQVTEYNGLKLLNIVRPWGLKRKPGRNTFLPLLCWILNGQKQLLTVQEQQVREPCSRNVRFMLTHSFQHAMDSIVAIYSREPAWGFSS